MRGKWRSGSLPTYPVPESSIPKGRWDPSGPLPSPPPSPGSPSVPTLAASQLGCTLGEVPDTRRPEAVPVGRRLGCRGSHHCLCSAKCVSGLPAKRGLSAARLLADARPLGRPAGPVLPSVLVTSPGGPGTPPGGASSWEPRGVTGQGPGLGHAPNGCTIITSQRRRRCVRVCVCVGADPGSWDHMWGGRLCPLCSVCEPVCVSVRVCAENCSGAGVTLRLSRLKGTSESFIHPLSCSFFHFTNDLNYFLWAQYYGIQT